MHGSWRSGQRGWAAGSEERSSSATEDRRHATSDAGRITAEAFSANLEHMTSVDQLRCVYRDLKNLKSPDSG
jgi:hypothetical protein